MNDSNVTDSWKSRAWGWVRTHVARLPEVPTALYDERHDEDDTRWGVSFTWRIDWRRWFH